MRCIEAVNELSRKVCVNPVPPEELHARLEAIRTAPDKLRCRLPLAYLITSGSVSYTHLLLQPSSCALLYR